MSSACLSTRDTRVRRHGEERWGLRPRIRLVTSQQKIWEITDRPSKSDCWIYAPVVSHLARISIQVWIEHFSLYAVATNIDNAMCQIVLSWDKIYIIGVQLPGEISFSLFVTLYLAINVYLTQKNTNENRSLKL